MALSSDGNQVAAYYANLLIKQYNGLPNASGTIACLAYYVAMNGLPTAVMNAYNLTGSNIAVGAQLDVLGKYAGVTRTGVGFNGAPITLSDSDFYNFIKLATAINSSGSSLSDIQQIIFNFFAGQMLVFDYTDMRLSYLISSSVGSQNLVQLFVTEGLLPKPMGVQLAVVIYAPVINNFFGFRTYRLPSVNAQPFNSYTSYNLMRPWLSYANAI